MNYSWILLLFLTLLEVLLFHTVYVDLVRSVIHLQTLTHSLSPVPGVQEEETHRSTSLLSLLSAVNLCISLLHVFSVGSDLPPPLSRISLLHQYKHYLRVSLSYWFLFKIVFSVCLLSLVWGDMETMEPEQVSILSLLASSTGFLCLVQRLSSDLSLLSSCSAPENVPGYHHYTPVRTEDTKENQEV